MYQVAWTRQFSLVFGSSEQAITAVLAAFLGGLGLGAALSSILSQRTSRPVLLYAFLELGAALSALAVPWAIRATKVLYVGLFGMQEGLPSAAGWSLTLFNLAVAFCVLAVPTICMGATLPLLARFAVRTRGEIGKVTGMLYAVNTAGAVVGAPLAGFLLLPRLGLERTVMVAVGLNLLAFVVSFLVSLTLAPTTSGDPRNAEIEPGMQIDRHGRILALLVICSGAVSLLYEVFWARLLSHLLGGSLYAFSTMLASFLAGIALGSAVASRFARNPERAVAGFAVAQLGIAACTAASYAAVIRYSELADVAWGSGRTLATDALLAAMALFPAAFFVGATFPFAVRVLARRTRDAAPASARVYAWGTLGSILGSIAAGLALLPALGFAGALTVAVATNLCLALGASLLLGSRRRGLATFALIGLVFVALLPPPTPWSILRLGSLYHQPIEGRVAYHAVGRSATVLLSEVEGSWFLSSNGLPEGSIHQLGAPMGGYLVTKWLGAMAVLVRPEIRSMMMIGLGTGEALEAVPETVRSIDIVELESEVVRANRVVASQRRRDPLAAPRVNLVINDARSALLLSGKTFDAVVSQPSHPWTSGSANLYTREFFELVRTRVRPDGVFVQWIGLAFIDEPLLRSMLATLTDVFPHVIVHRPPTGAALLFLASESPFGSGISPAAATVTAQTQPELGIARWEDIAGSVVLDEEGARDLGAGAPLIRDNQNLLEILSPRAVGQAMGRDLGERYLAPWDPLIRHPEQSVDRAYLVRRFISIGRIARARRLTEAMTNSAQQQVARALLAEAGGRVPLAIQLVADSLSRDPDGAEARGLSLRLRRAQIARGGSPDPRMVPLRETEDAVVAAWISRARGEEGQVAILEPALARIRPGDPLYREATRLRAAWRLEAGSSANAREAIRLIDPLLARGRTADDLLMRAHAALAASDSRGVLATLSQLADSMPNTVPRESWAGPARAIVERLPDDPSVAEWRMSLLGRIAGDDRP